MGQNARKSDFWGWRERGGIALLCRILQVSFSNVET